MRRKKRTIIRNVWILWGALASAGCTAILGDFSPGGLADAGPDALERSVPDAGMGDASRSPPNDGGTGTDADGSVDASTKGADASAPLPLPTLGEVVISEVMYFPTDEPFAPAQWIELYNGADAGRLLSGLTLADGTGHTHTIGSSPWITIASHAYVLIADDVAQLTGKDTVPDAAIVYQYSGLALATGIDASVSLSSGNTVLALVPYGLFEMNNQGHSIELSTLNVAAEGSSLDWCHAQTSWTLYSDYGTPGQPNDCY